MSLEDLDFSSGSELEIAEDENEAEAEVAEAEPELPEPEPEVSEAEPELPEAEPVPDAEEPASPPEVPVKPTPSGISAVTFTVRPNETSGITIDVRFDQPDEEDETEPEKGNVDISREVQKSAEEESPTVVQILVDPPASKSQLKTEETTNEWPDSEADCKPPKGVFDEILSAIFHLWDKDEEADPPIQPLLRGTLREFVSSPDFVDFLIESDNDCDEGCSRIRPKRTKSAPNFPSNPSEPGNPLEKSTSYAPMSNRESKGLNDLQSSLAEVDPNDMKAAISTLSPAVTLNVTAPESRLDIKSNIMTNIDSNAFALPKTGVSKIQDPVDATASKITTSPDTVTKSKNSISGSAAPPSVVPSKRPSNVSTSGKAPEPSRRASNMSATGALPPDVTRRQSTKSSNGSDEGKEGRSSFNIKPADGDPYRQSLTGSLRKQSKVKPASDETMKTLDDAARKKSSIKSVGIPSKKSSIARKVSIVSATPSQPQKAPSKAASAKAPSVSASKSSKAAPPPTAKPSAAPSAKPSAAPSAKASKASKPGDEPIPEEPVAEAAEEAKNSTEEIAEIINVDELERELEDEQE